VKKILLWVWQLPQHLVALVILLVLKTEKQITSDGIVWYKVKQLFGVSLGDYIFLYTDDPVSVKHEHGHSLQSKLLGWFYLPIVGIYSAVFCNLYSQKNLSKWKGWDRGYWYYNRWTEKWADKLGGVDRIAWLWEKYPKGGVKYKESDKIGVHPLLPMVCIILVITAIAFWTYLSYLYKKTENTEGSSVTNEAVTE